MKHALGFVINFALVSASSNHESTRQGKHCAAGKGGGGCGVAAPYEEDGKKQYQDDADEAVQLPAPVEGLVLPYGFVPDGLFFFRHCHNAVCPVADNVVVLRQVGRRRQRSRMETPGYHYLHVLVGQDLLDKLRGFDDGFDSLPRLVLCVFGHLRAFSMAR